MQQSEWVTSYLSQKKIAGHNDFAKTAQIDFKIPKEVQKLITFFKKLQSNTTIIHDIGINVNEGKWIHLLRTRDKYNHPYKYKMTGISKTLVDINTKSISNAKAA